MPCHESSRVPVSGTASVSHNAINNIPPEKAPCWAHKLYSAVTEGGDWLMSVFHIHLRKCRAKRNDLVLNKFFFKPREMTEKIETSGKRQPWQVVCVLKILKCWGAWHTNCGHKAKDITISIAWRREAWTEEVLDDLPTKDERGPSSNRRALEMFQTYRWRNFWETVWSAYGLLRARIYQLHLNCT